MTAKQIKEILKASNLWAPLTEEQKQEAVRDASKSTGTSVTEVDIRTTVGEVYLELN